MADFSPAVLNPTSGEVALNMKQMAEDNSADARRRTSINGSHDNAWETLRYRIANEAQTVSHLAELNLITASQTGDTSNQQTTSPIRTGAADNIAAGSTPANRITDTTGAVAGGAINSATAADAFGNVTAQLATLTTQVVGLAQTITDSNATIVALLTQLVQKNAPASN